MRVIDARVNGINKGEGFDVNLEVGKALSTHDWKAIAWHPALMLSRVWIDGKTVSESSSDCPPPVSAVM